MNGRLILVAAVVGATLWAGQKVSHEANQHVVKPVYHHVLRPIGQALKKLK